MKVCVRTSQATGFFCLTQTLSSTLANSKDTKPLEKEISHSPGCLYSKNWSYSLAHDQGCKHSLESCFLEYPMGYTVLKPRVGLGTDMEPEFGMWTTKGVGKHMGKWSSCSCWDSIISEGTTRFLDNIEIICSPRSWLESVVSINAETGALLTHYAHYEHSLIPVFWIFCTGKQK